MPNSMTGYGRGEMENDGLRVTVETRSVNHRFIDFNIKTTGKMFQLDDNIRKAVKSKYSRGSFDVTVNFAGEATGANVTVNEELLEGYMDAASKLAEKYGVKYPPSIGELLTVKDLFSVTDSGFGPDQVWALLEPALESALDKLGEMRKTEGSHISADLKTRIEMLSSMTAEVEKESAKAAEERYDSLRKRLKRLVDDMEIDDGRLAQEAAILADRADITEELTRLASHLNQAGVLLAGDGPVGRKLEFILQEIHRESNTIGSKTTSTAVTNIVVDMKSELEKIKEQIQNLE